MGSSVSDMLMVNLCILSCIWQNVVLHYYMKKKKKNLLNHYGMHASSTLLAGAGV